MFTTPGATPVTTPVVVTVAREVLPLLHVPPDGVEVSVIELPTQTVPGPATVAEEITTNVVVT